VQIVADEQVSQFGMALPQVTHSVPNKTYPALQVHTDPLNPNCAAESQLVHAIEEEQVRHPGIADAQVRHNLVIGSTK
jgi:hypothetical protein